MASVFSADYEGLYTIFKEVVGVVYGSAYQNHEEHSVVHQQKKVLKVLITKTADKDETLMSEVLQQMDEFDYTDRLKDKYSTPVSPFPLWEIRLNLLLLQNKTLNNLTMESTMKGFRPEGFMRMTIKPKFIFLVKDGCSIGIRERLLCDFAREEAV